VIEGVEVIRLFSPRIKVLGALIFLFCLAVYLIKNRRHVSLIHTFQIGYTSFVSILISILLKKPSIMKLASSGWGGDIQRAKKTSFGRIFLFMAKKASRIITLSATIEQELMEEKVDSSRLCLIHNGVDLIKFREIEGKGRLRNKLGITDKRTIIYTGRLSPEKGVDFLIRGFSKLDKNLNCQMIIIADGPERKSIVQLVDQYQLSKSVILLKGVDEVADYLNASNIFVLPSRFEGLSNSLLEAMACGLPVISTMVGGSIDIIEDGINGLLIDVDNEEQLIQAMTHILNDSTMAATMGRNARKVIEKYYALDKIADRYISLYKDL
jgi:glycosyltransferase involved in cell wall biosynthesis